MHINLRPKGGLGVQYHVILKGFIEIRKMQTPHEIILFIARDIIFENCELPVITLRGQAKP